MNERVQRYLKEKRQPLLIIGAAVAAVAIWAGAAAVLGPSEAEKEAESKARVDQMVKDISASFAKIRYDVGGTTTQASITLQTPTGSSQQSDIDVPLKLKSGAVYLEYTFSAGDFVYLSAQNSKGYGTVTCRITTDDGDVISENSASGGYAIATCKGSAR